MTEKLKKTRPRKKEIIEYEPDEIGQIVINRCELAGEVDSVVGASGHAYAHKSLIGKKVKMFIYRDQGEEKKEDGKD
jgi:hypothetical protein